MAITFEQYRTDNQCQALARLLSQFNESKTGIQPFINALTQQTKDWNEITQTVFFGRFLEVARGVNLEVIGRIIGQDRPLVDGTEIVYFTPDSTIAGNLGGTDTAPVFVTNAPTAGLVLASDIVYRQYIKAKIFKNQVTGGSAPELKQFIKTGFGLEVSVQPAVGETLAIDLYISSDTPTSLVKLFMSKTSTTLVENSYYVPVPCCTRIASVTLMPKPVFATDTLQTATRAGTDNGLVAIKIAAGAFN